MSSSCEADTFFDCKILRKSGTNENNPHKKRQNRKIHNFFDHMVYSFWHINDLFLRVTLKYAAAFHAVRWSDLLSDATGIFLF